MSEKQFGSLARWSIAINVHVTFSKLAIKIKILAKKLTLLSREDYEISSWSVQRNC